VRYGIIGYGAGRKSTFKRHFGLIYNNGDGDINLTLLNKSHSKIIKGRNVRLFNKFLRLLNKHYDLENLNEKIRRSKGLRGKKMKSKKEIVSKTKYQSNSPGRYWIKMSDANRLREKAIRETKIEMNLQISERLTKLELENKKFKR